MPMQEALMAHRIPTKTRANHNIPCPVQKQNKTKQNTQAR